MPEHLKSKNPDFLFGKLLHAIETQNKRLYIEAIGALEEVHAETGFIPSSINSEDGIRFMYDYLWKIAEHSVDPKLTLDEKIDGICRVLADNGYLEMRYTLPVDKTTKDPA